ncbi:rNA polymerase sigma factor [Clostridium sp. CAG:288]|nr:rNA polymerase sigma factor [Clostridium sp. CAG:288]
MSNFKVNITGIDTNKLKVLKSDETIELLKRLRAGENVKDEIVMGNLKLVLSAVKPYRSQKYSLDDLFQIGVIGLIKSIDNFDVSKNVMFSTYAVPMIRGEIKRYVRDSVSILRVSRQVKDLAYHCFKAKEELTQQLERSPTYEEISKYLNIKKEQVKEAFESFNPVMSFSEPINNTDEDSLELYDIISDPEDLEEKVITNLTLKTALNSLNEIERRIIDNRYFEGLTQMEVAQEFNISQAQVSRLEKQALKNMRKFFK